jgi:MoaA/NifB/PqqE/SkfB family radical SAM enzyme
MNYFELTPEENTFSNIVVDLTHRCNMECANCYIPNREIPDLDKEKLYNFLSRLPFRTYIRLIGAEPTMREDLFEIISTVKKLGHRPSLTTNGLKLAQESYVNNLKESGLRLLLLSMNGADEDEIYKVLDNGKWATVKVRALENIFKHRLPVNTGTIIAKGVNEHTIKRHVDLFVNKAIEYGINFDKDKPYNKITPVLRFKSVGLIGRNMGKNFFYSKEEWANLASSQLGLSYDSLIKSTATSGVVKAGSYGKAETSLLFPYHSQAGKIFIRFIDWETNDEGVIDHDNPNRGRLTENWTVAPFFEHIKINEFKY